MKFILSFLTVVLFSSLAFANTTLDNEYLLNKFTSGASVKAQLGTLIQQTQNLLVARYSFAVQGGSSAASISLLTNLNDSKSLAVLPNKAIIKNVWIDTLTQPAATAGAASVSLKAVSTGDLLAALAKGSFTGFIQGIPDDTVTHAIKLTGKKTISADITVNPLTAGKFDVYIEWVLGN